MLVRMHQYGLLPGASREEFLDEVRRRAVEVPDPAFLTSPTIRSALPEDEIAGVLTSVKDEFIPALEDTVDGWTVDYSGDGDPEGHFKPLMLALSAYSEALVGDSEAEKAIGKAVKAIEEATSDLAREDEMAAEAAADYSREQGPKLLAEERSVFDDIDDEP